jgi:hypothetical protein
MRRKTKANLSMAQIEIVGQFNDHSFENPRLSFDQVAKRILGPKPFPNTPAGRKFKKECRVIFDREHS